MNLVILKQPTSAAAEAYRSLRANLNFASLEKPLRAVAIVSAVPDEGAIQAVANLAVAYAQIGRRVAVVDADLRAPSLHTVFGCPQSPGLTELLEGADPGSVLHTCQVAGLSIIPSGKLPQVPSDVISSARLKAALDGALANTELTLFNVAPLSVASDGAVLAALMDGVVLVLRAGRTRREAAQEAQDILARAHARVLGAVLLDA